MKVFSLFSLIVVLFLTLSACETNNGNYDVLCYYCNESCGNVCRDDESTNQPTPQPSPFVGFPVVNVDSTYAPRLSESNSFNRTNWRDVRVTISNTPEEFQLFEVNAQLRGRGNSSWNAPKRPFRLRFDNERVAMPNADHVARDWTFITNHADFSLFRNYGAYYLANLMGGVQAPYSQFAHVYFDGVYQGVYKISVHIPEPVHHGTGRVQTVRHPNPAHSEYILEKQLLYRLTQDAHLQHGRDWFTVGDFHFHIRDGGTSPAHVAYVRNLMTWINDTIMDRCASVFNMICKESFVDWYIIHELFRDHDSGRASQFMQIRGHNWTRRLVIGPVWDFEHTAGATTFQLQGHPYYVWLPNGNPYTGRYPHHWYQNLMKIPEFRAAVAVRMAEVNEYYLPRTLAFLWQMYFDYEDEFARNFQRWEVFGSSVLGTSAEKRAITSHFGQLTWLTEWLTQRAAWLDGYFNNSSPYFETTLLRFDDLTVQAGSNARFVHIELGVGRLPRHLTNFSLVGYEIFRVEHNGELGRSVSSGRFSSSARGSIIWNLPNPQPRDSGTYRVVLRYTLTWGQHTLNLTQPFGDITLEVS
ncbi:MAG: CotH kinase family protein [Oscillospiraceae bacterium]|nr:CotH kinase family protein [Oscillospiraceae bacterium]